MEIQTDQGLLVVNLDNCVSNAAVHQMVKGDCNIYTVAVANGNEGPTMLQIPVSLQCNSNVQQTFNTVAQLQHLTSNVTQQYNHQDFNQVPLTEQLQCLVGRNEPSQSSQLQTETISSNKLPISQLEDNNPVGLQHSSRSASKIDYNDIYNFIAIGLIPKGTSNEYKRILKKRSHHYCIIDKTLYYGRNQPRKVLIGRGARQEILKNYHITKETGVHLGVRKMHASIASLYFWQEMYVDIATYVRDCSGCSETATLVSESIKNTSNNCNNMPIEAGASLLHDNTSKIWQNVEVHMYGPYSRTVRQNQYILSILDPVSKWIMALPVPNNNLANRMASFIFESFCIFGFARCSVVGVTSEYFVSLKSKYQEYCKQIHQTMPHIELVDAHTSPSQCLWAEQLIDSMTSANPADWDREQDKFLYKFRTTALNDGPSPFDMMFQRSAKSKVEENKENSRLNDTDELTDVSSKRRKLQCSILQCRHCDEDFTSKISFRIHQRKHTEEARLRGKLEGQELLTMIDDAEDTEDQTLKKRTVMKKKQKLFRHTESSNRTNQLLAIVNRNNDLRVNQHPTLPKDVHRAELKATTLAAVRHMLASTKEERRKRGRYHKYPAELQEEMANYAIEHGNHETVNIFSHRLGCTVSESTIRNIVKLYRSFTPEIKEEIGRFAAAFGIESAANHFTARLGREVRQGLVRKFKKLYLRRYPDSTSKIQVGTIMKKNNVPNGAAVSKKKTPYRYTAELKEEIGCHACLHNINDTIRHYSQKLQISLMNNTVRRFRKLYLDKHQPLELSTQASLLQQQLQQNLTSVRNGLNSGEPSTNQTIDVLNASLSILNNAQVQSSTTAYNQPYQSTLNQNTPLTFHTLNQCATSNVPTNVSMTYHHNQTPSSVIVNQNQNDIAFNQTLNSMHSYQQQSHQDYISYEQPQQTLQTAVSLPQQSSVNHHNMGHMVSSSSSLHPQGPALTMVAPSLPPQPQYSSSPTVMGHQSSPMASRRPLVFSQQQLAQLQSQQKQQEQANVQHLITAEQNTQQNCTQSLSTSFVQSLSSNTQFSFGNSIPVLIADRDGTYTLTTALNTEESVSLDENMAEPIVIKLKSQANENMLDKQQDISNVILQEDQKCVQNMIERRPMMSTSENRQSKHDTEPLTFVEVQLSCNSMEESVDDPDYVGDSGEYDDENDECGTNQDIVSNVKKDERLSAKKKSMKKRKESLGKRGQYTTYSPELRAEMGKYAAEHGSQRTCQHFRAQLGHDIPESTVRGLRDKYLLKREQKSDEVTSLGYSPRGRPVRLGKYDEVVQECIRELVKSGEKISSFLAIATAKQVLMQYEPSLLEANGGNIKLNITWAKSFLKRIGVHNNC